MPLTFKSTNKGNGHCQETSVWGTLWCVACAHQKDPKKCRACVTVSHKQWQQRALLHIKTCASSERPSWASSRACVPHDQNRLACCKETTDQTLGSLGFSWCHPRRQGLPHKCLTGSDCNNVCMVLPAEENKGRRKWRILKVTLMQNMKKVAIIPKLTNYSYNRRQSQEKSHCSEPLLKSARTVCRDVFDWWDLVSQWRLQIVWLAVLLEFAIRIRIRKIVCLRSLQVSGVVVPNVEESGSSGWFRSLRHITIPTVEHWSLKWYFQIGNNHEKCNCPSWYDSSFYSIVPVLCNVVRFTR